MRRPRIILVGPIYPYRGGIAQYSTQLVKSLAKVSQVTTVSFKRQYPVWLYPGEDDKEKAVELKAEGVDFSLSIYSPLSWYRVAKKIAAEKPDLVIFCWWTLIWQPAFAWMSKKLRRQGLKTFFLCHNLYDHDTNSVAASLSKIMLKQADGYIVHSEDQQKELQQLAPKAEIIYRPLPIFSQFPAAKLHLKKRGRLELLFFGFIKPYKGLDILLEALRQLNDSTVFLTVAGEAWGDVGKIKSAVENQKIPNVELILKYVDEQTASQYFDRADLVVLPYASATGSGVASLAYNYRKPVLASKVGGLKEVVMEGKTGWLVEPESSAEIKEALLKINRQDTKAMAAHIKNFCNDNSWDNMTREIIKSVIS